MDHITQKVYTHMKSTYDQNGFAPTVRQTAERLQLEDREVEDAIRKLEQLGRIVITDIPAKSIIEFVDESGQLQDE